MIEVRNLSKQYDPKHPPAVDNISYDVQAGELFSLLGPNGAGKSTTIGMLCGLLRPTSGDAKIGPYSIRTATLAAKRLIGIVPQEIALYPTLSARQNLHFWGQMYDMQGKALSNRVEEVLDQIGLRERANDRIDTYSGGMKRRVNIGAGLLHRPQVLFMDEPTVGIDPQSRRAILDMTKQLNAEGMTVLYTTHYMEEAQELSHRIGIQDHGKLIALGTLAELTRLVGETDTLKLQVSELADNTETARLDLQLGALPGVRNVTRQADTLTLLIDNANTRLAEVINCCSAVGVHITAIEVHEPNLEQVFLHLTGRALRD
ncbi:MAG: ABC transporter ATP-binding protein [Chloroflexi bacterium]|nr:ABC transporter ATP-binding protein [Chloroflexota bacterium]